MLNCGSDFGLVLCLGENSMSILFGESLKNYNRTFLRMDEFYHNIATKSGLSDCAFWILYSICEDGDGCSQKMLCDKLSVSKQTVHSAIRKLEQDNILYLKAGKGRDKYIYLTETGKLFVEEKIAAIISIENAAFTSMGEQYAKEFERLTELYVGLLRENYEAMMQRKKGEQ